MSSIDVREPGLQVLVNGIPLGGVYEAEILSDSYLGANRFTFRAALAAANIAGWAIVPSQIEILAGFNGVWQSLITGQADNLEIDPIRGDIKVDGRDLTALLVAAQTHESFENLTASEVTILVAGRHGLSASVKPTTALTGRFYQNGHTRTALSQHGRATTEWDVLSWLAQQEGYDIWVQGRTLYFQPPQFGLDISLVLPTDCLGMTLSRDLTIASGFTVEVQSWDCASQQLSSQTVAYGTAPTQVGNMIMLRPNLSTIEAQSLAQRIATQLGSHERRISYEIPADITTFPRSQIQLLESNTDFDGVYTVYEVERRFSSRRGFRQRVEARRASWTIS